MNSSEIRSFTLLLALSAVPIFSGAQAISAAPSALTLVASTATSASGAGQLSPASATTTAPLAAWVPSSTNALPAANPQLAAMAREFTSSIARSVILPEDVTLRYAQLVNEEIKKKGVHDAAAQFFIVVDRNPHVQIGMIFWKDVTAHQTAPYMLIGATFVATGGTARFDHYITPTGVFEHHPEHADYRAEGTKNENGIRGYGRRGDRVMDFGWQETVKAWGAPETRQIRMQMHSTDFDILESKLGSVGSKGCVRVPSAMNRFVDHFGLLDADYEASAIQTGTKPWVWRADRTPTPWSGKYLVVVDSGVTTTPEWMMKKK
jgi:hypothetical protein